MQKFKKICKNGDVEKAEQFIRKESKLCIQFNYFGFYYACKYGNLDIIDLLIKNGKYNLNKGLNGACRGGHVDIVKFIIKKGIETNCLFAWNLGLRSACEGGNLNIVKLIIEKGSKSFYWDKGLRSACNSGHINIVKLLIEKGIESNYEFDWNLGLVGACQGGHMNIVKLMIEKGAILKNNIYLRTYLEKNCNYMYSVSFDKFYKIYRLCIINSINLRTIEKQNTFLLNLNKDLTLNVVKFI